MIRRGMRAWRAGAQGVGVGLCGSLIFLWSGLALPWMLGSLLACALWSLAGGRGALPAAWRGLAMAALGTLLGGSVGPQALLSWQGWLPTLSVMLGLTVAYLLLGYGVMQRWSGLDRLSAWFAAMPGGLSLVSAIADAYRIDSRRIALSHTARLVALLVLAPLLLHYVGGYDLSAAGSTGGTQPAAAAVSWSGALAVLGCGVAGWLLAQALRFPTGMLLFPLLFSAVVHAAGWTHAQVPAGVSAAAQLIIGAGIGLKFVGYSFRVLWRDGWLAVLLGVLLAGLAWLAAWALQAWTGQDFGPLLLILLPGGAPELGVMALALDMDPGMVAVHHLVRVLFVVGLLGWMTRRLKQRSAASSA